MGVALYKPIKLLVLYLSGAAVGWLFLKIGMPLPFMIGPLIFAAFIYVTGLATTPVTAKTRPLGQMIIASTVGLAFTSDALDIVMDMAPIIVGLTLLTSINAVVVSMLLKRFSHLDYPTALLSTMPTSPVEAVVVAEKFGLNRGLVVLSQTIRIAIVVVLIPVAIYAADGWPGNSGRGPGAASSFDLGGVILLSISAVAGGLLFKAIRLPNPYFFGALFCTAVVSSCGLHVTPYPYVILAGAQVVLGSWLGSVFTKDLFFGGGKLTLALILSMLCFILFTSATAIAFAHLIGQPWETMVLSAAPGGVTEMALTAQFLGYDVAIITSFQIVRICILLPGIHWFIAAARRV
ncbi:AbrB family transcriptional regulator [Marinobacterium sedimentorum]|uniref:AbrB family transcriptional regulator n=1 Tax=Marinobacterium sedimentorum TaxID=2927804 RepID=UPI0020C68BC5|nr:AbrB family transcriptional regulator [Marinobacterium sedimentorum]MCP8687663.1 AbrB family transcriptional regulator [Marinobacterium sedimentorum]